MADQVTRQANGMAGDPPRGRGRRCQKDGSWPRTSQRTGSEQRAEGPWVPGFLKPLEQNMLDLDDPDHKRLRASYPRRLRLV